jgi:hypothetical protein
MQQGMHHRMGASITNTHTSAFNIDSRGFAMSKIIFLFDVDNTLLDNDRVTADLKHHLEQQVGAERQQRYWDFFEQLRTELGYADYLGALQRYRLEYPRDPSLLTVSHFLINYPFATRLYPDSLDAIEHVKQWGTAAILSDGDVVFQPRKVERSGIYESVNGNVLIYIITFSSMTKSAFSPKSKKSGAAKSQLFFLNKGTTRSIQKLLRLIPRRISRWSESASC